MENIKVPEKEVPIVKETDVIVIGGGVAGVAAAVAAARQGVKVTLIEKSIVLGGLATSGHVCVYLPIDDGNGNKVYGGLAEELLHICIRYSQNNLPEVWKSKPDTAPPDSERYMANFFIPHAVLSLDEFTEKEGVDVVFDAVFSEPIMEGNTVKGIIVESKSGRTAYMAKMFVDASGDADFRAELRERRMDLPRAGGESAASLSNDYSHDCAPSAAILRTMSRAFCGVSDP